MMGLVNRIPGFKLWGQKPVRTRSDWHHRPACETLEGRPMLSGLGTDYTLMGGQWDNSRAITYSFAPDGVNWDTGVNNVNATLDAAYGGTSWHQLVTDALQVWSAATNLNFVEVSDGPYDFNASGQEQSDSRFGDIRIGGNDLSATGAIARTYGPPPNGQTGAGEVELNTSLDLGPNSKYSLEAVLVHELGHALGLGESPQASSVMYSYYAGNRTSLSSYDVEGIQSLYGTKLADPYQSQGLATSPTTALDLTSYLNSTNETELSGVSLWKIGDTEYYSVVAPAINGSEFRVAAKASGFSLLSPKLSVIDPSTGATLASAGDPTQDGNYVSVAISNAQPGHRYLIAITGATRDVFSVGAYSVQVGFFGGTAVNPTPSPAPVAPAPVAPAPVAPAPVAPAPVISPDQYASHTTFANAAELGSVQQTIINNLTIPSASDVHVFAFEVPHAGPVLIASANTTILVGDFQSRLVVSGTGLIGFVAPTAGARYYLVFLSPNGGPVASFGFAVATNPATSKVSAASVAIPIPNPVAESPSTPPTSSSRNRSKKK